jgi:hypothetical protein
VSPLDERWERVMGGGMRRKKGEREEGEGRVRVTYSVRGEMSDEERKKRGDSGRQRPCQDSPGLLLERLAM